MLSFKLIYTTASQLSMFYLFYMLIKRPCHQNGRYTEFQQQISFSKEMIKMKKN